MKIADKKARQAWKEIQKPLVVWDLSLYIECLNGFPGPLIKWFWEQITCEKICEIARHFGNQNVYTETVLTYCNGEKTLHFTGRIDGTIPESPRGDKGWSWDTMFIPHRSEKTYAEMHPEEVIHFRSHKIALELLRDFLLKQ